jgi:hypothetical protein
MRERFAPEPSVLRAPGAAGLPVVAPAQMALLRIALGRFASARRLSAVRGRGRLPARRQAPVAR